MKLSIGMTLRRHNACKNEIFILTGSQNTAPLTCSAVQATTSPSIRFHAQSVLKNSQGSYLPALTPRLEILHLIMQNAASK
jgi:hypothetical protein